MWVAYNSIKRKTVYRWHEYCLRLPSDYALCLPWVELAGWISCFKTSASVLVFEPPLFPNYLDFWYLLLREVASVIELVQIDRRTDKDRYYTADSMYIPECFQFQMIRIPKRKWVYKSASFLSLPLLPPFPSLPLLTILQ